MIIIIPTIKLIILLIITLLQWEFVVTTTVIFFNTQFLLSLMRDVVNISLNFNLIFKVIKIFKL